MKQTGAQTQLYIGVSRGILVEKLSPFYPQTLVLTLSYVAYKIIYCHVYWHIKHIKINNRIYSRLIHRR